MFPGIHILRTENWCKSRMGKEIKIRSGMGWNALGRQHNIMEINITLTLKRKVYNQYILPVLTYGSETWSLMKVMEQKLQCPKGNGENNA